MLELPGPYEEDHLPQRLVGIDGEHVDDAARAVAEGLGDAPVVSEARRELVRERRIVKADRDAHRSGLSELLPPADQDHGLVVARPSTSVAAETANHSKDMRTLVDLATRRAGGIEVALIWDRAAKTLVVFAHDERTDEEISIPVDGDEATEVYRHPFAYAHRSSAVPVRRRRATRA
jgi:hypothetical protein